jgi:predicted nucleic acid-binding protein
LNQLFAALTFVAIDAEVGRKAGGYLREFRRSHAVEIADALIAASASARRAQLWTRNRKHYPMKDVLFFD